MAVSFYSASWHRVSNLKPRLRAHVRLHRQVYRDDVWYVVQDNQSGRFHRLTQDTYVILSMMDGKHSVEEIWSKSIQILGARQPSQDELISLLTFLHNGDLLLSGKNPDLDELNQRSARMKRMQVMSRIKNPMALRFSLFDPNRFLDLTIPFTRWMFSWKGALAWTILILWGVIVAVQNISEMSDSVLEHVLTTNNLFLLAGIYPVMKGLHELGHAYAVKRWGGEVHEIGIMLLVFVPAPYVDASASIAFTNKWQRALVSAAGIAVEMALAAVAVLIWSVSEPGQIRAAALNVAFIGSVSTLLFNGNPLLRFDGYYVLSDIIESPNLGKRSNDYFFYLIKRYVFRIENLKKPVVALGEEPWLIGYSIGSFIYRMIVMIGIALYIAGKFFFIGVGLALISVFGAVVVPFLKGIKFLVQDPALKGRRTKALALSASAMTILFILLFAIPMPYYTVATGVLWVDEDEATVRAGSDGFIDVLHFDRPSAVTKDTVLIEMVDPVLLAEAELSKRKIAELNIKEAAADVSDLVEAALVREKQVQENAHLSELEERIRKLQVKAKHDGVFTSTSMTDYENRYRKRGELLGYLVRPQDRIVRLIVPQTQIEPVREQTESISVRLSDDFKSQFEGRLLREQPGAVTRLPSASLSSLNGGPVATDPADPEALKPLETVYELQLSINALPDDTKLGQRAYVRFQHRPQALGFRLIRQIRQVFLRTFNV